MRMRRGRNALILAALLATVAVSSFLCASHTSRHQNSHGRWAYVFLDIGPEFACPLLVQLAALASTLPDPSIEVVVMTHAATLAMPAGVRTIRAPAASTVGLHQWRTSYDKLFFSTLLDYERVIFLELDNLILGNLDHLFTFTPFKTTIAVPRAYWLPQPFVQTGPVVGDPSAFALDRHFAPVLFGDQKQMHAGDNDFVNQEFGNTVTLLHGFYALLVGEWIRGDGIFGFWGQEFNMTAAEVFAAARLVHFVAPQNKPWKTTREELRQRHPDSPAELYAAYERWFGLQDRVC